MAQTSIEWCDIVWNPVTGCTKVSRGCSNCYAETIAKRFWGSRKFGDVQCHEDRLDQPLRWRKPRRIFVNSMSDLFHDRVPFPFICDVIQATRRANPRHQYLVLTKRPERMLEFQRWHNHKVHLGCIEDQLTWPRNWWLGVSAEDQESLARRIVYLLQCNAAVRWVSLEPLLELIRLGRWLYETDDQGACHCCGHPVRCRNEPGFHRLDWVVVGGESGPNARPCDLSWVRSILEQCRAADVRAFFKQAGSRPYDGWCHCPGQGRVMARLQFSDTKGGDMSEWPADLRVREYPRLKGAAES